MVFALLRYNFENLNKQEIKMNNKITRNHSISISYNAIAVLEQVKGSVRTGLNPKA